MFDLSRSAQRRLALLAFVTLALLPALVVLAVGLRRHWPGANAAEAERLGQWLGCDVVLAEVGFPRPGEVVYSGLAAYDPETHSRLFYCPQLYCTTTGDGVCLRSQRFTFDQASLECLGRMANDVLSMRIRRPRCVSIEVGELILSREPGGPAVYKVCATLSRCDGETQGEVRFQLAGGSASPVKLTVGRLHHPQPSTTVALDTGSTKVPCSLIALAIPAVAAAGPDACFRGRAWICPEPNGWSGGISGGQVTDLDLSRLAAGRLGHYLNGRARLDIATARLSRGSVDELLGSLAVAEPGVVGFSLLESAVVQLGFVPGTVPSAPNGLVPYAQLALSFHLSPAGLRIRGDLPAREGLVMAGAAGPLLAQPAASQPRPVQDLVVALAGSGPLAANLGPYAAGLAARLPWPNPAAAAPPPSQVRTAQATGLATPSVH